LFTVEFGACAIRRGFLAVAYVGGTLRGDIGESLPGKGEGELVDVVVDPAPLRVLQQLIVEGFKLVGEPGQEGV